MNQNFKILCGHKGNGAYDVVNGGKERKWKVYLPNSKPQQICTIHIEEHFIQTPLTANVTFDHYF